jgi:hypothetical protein
MPNALILKPVWPTRRSYRVSCVEKHRARATYPKIEQISEPKQNCK